MVKLVELKTIDDYLKLPEIPSSEIDWEKQWIDDEYDGKRLSGVLVYRGKKYWYKAFDEFDYEADEYKRIMKYVVVELTPAQLALLEFLREQWLRLIVDTANKPMEERSKFFHEFEDLVKAHNISLTQLHGDLKTHDAPGWFERDARS